jgi:hypothetical protein
VYEKNHTQSYWGANYARLLQLKNKYDPRRLMDCWQCGERFVATPALRCHRS